MDNLTHSLTGALIGQCGLKKKTGLAMPALIIGANLPDVDAACFFWLDGVEHLAFRRGITHGPPALLLLPLALAGLLYGWDKWQARRGKRPEGRLPVNFTWLYILSLIGCLSHPALDWMNVYGIRLLEPFSSRWFYGDVLFIIDIWLWALLIFSVWFSLRREKAGGEWIKPARAAMAVMLAYIGVNGLISRYAASAGGSESGEGIEVIASPPPVMFWNRDLIFHTPGADPLVANPMTAKWSLFDPGPVQAFASPGGGFAISNSEGQNSQRPFEELADNPQVAPFLFWSRAPFTTCEEGAVILGDARYPGRGNFRVELPEIPCEPNPAN
ncbi:metal-dependent hydrolase [Altererythrobacter lauratis]|uniref:Metal-dependent hydrolase n=1 Tax=Alteraurantiacibacter lauratis TaxID=2054627 RepID=A0ABV7E9B7_9SPHN